jgi:hypothetical protein
MSLRSGIPRQRLREVPKQASHDEARATDNVLGWPYHYQLPFGRIRSLTVLRQFFTLGHRWAWARRGDSLWKPAIVAASTAFSSGVLCCREELYLGMNTVDVIKHRDELFADDRSHISRRWQPGRGEQDKAVFFGRRYIFCVRSNRYLT